MNAAPRTKVVTLTLCNEAHDFLKSLVYGHRGYGQALSQILLAEKARREERERIVHDLVQRGGLQ